MAKFSVSETFSSQAQFT